MKNFKVFVTLFLCVFCLMLTLTADAGKPPAPTAPSVALNCPATASSEETAGTGPQYAVDGSTTTRWSSLFSDPQWISVDLGCSYAVTKVTLIWEAAYATAYKVQLSDNGSTWVDVYSTTAGVGGTVSVTVPSTSGRYVRMYGTARATVYGYSIFELLVEGTALGNAPPSCSLTAPLNGAVYATAPAAVTITATATDTNGISKVDFYQGTTLVGTDTTSPYSVVWNAPAGSYVLKAKATDTLGAEGFSGTVSIRVGPPPSPAWLMDGVTFGPFHADDVGASTNNELQYYSPANIAFSGGSMVITGIQDSSHAGYAYTSGKATTYGNTAGYNTYGVFETRIKAPKTQGSWPAFWGLGTNIFSGTPWPACGELDIMEHVSNLTYNTGSAHRASDRTGRLLTTNATYTVDVSQYQVYKMEWTSTYLKYYVNGVNFLSIDITDGINSTSAFHLPFWWIINLAVGGNWPGTPDATTVWPMIMYIDYISGGVV